MRNHSNKIGFIPITGWISPGWREGDVLSCGLPAYADDLRQSVLATLVLSYRTVSQQKAAKSLPNRYQLATNWPPINHQNHYLATTWSLLAPVRRLRRGYRYILPLSSRSLRALSNNLATKLLSLESLENALVTKASPSHRRRCRPLGRVISLKACQ